MKKVRKAIIPAAGLGTRFLPATKAMPKEMLPIVDKPTIQYIVEEAIESGIEDIIIVTGKGKRAIEDHFDHAFELEQNLLKKAKSIYFKKYSSLPKWQTFITSARKNQRVLVMRYGAHVNSLGTSRSLYCLVTTSYRRTSLA